MSDVDPTDETQLGAPTADPAAVRVCPLCHREMATARCGDHKLPTEPKAAFDEARADGVHGKLVGRVVAGRYVIAGVLGAGGMGAVYRGYNTELRQPIALKVLRPDRRQDDGTFARFQREARISASLQHPNTVRVYDFGTLEPDQGTDGVAPFYLAMELLDGTPLDRVLKQAAADAAPVAPLRAARVGLQIAKSLAEAHAAGVIHRDLKPGNVVLCTIHGEPDFVKVLDFGIAKRRGDLDDTAMTTTGVFMGTPAYASPEQIDASTVDGRADLYSLGTILYELLSGRPPFTAETSFKILLMHQTQTPAPLETLVEAGPELAAVGRIAMKLLQKDPAHRYQTAEEVVGALEGVVATLRDHDARPPAGHGGAAPRGLPPTPAAAPDAAAPRGGAGGSKTKAGPTAVTWVLGALGVAVLGALIALGSRAGEAPDIGGTSRDMATAGSGDAAGSGVARPGVGGTSSALGDSTDEDARPAPRGMVRFPAGDVTLGSSDGPKDAQPPLTVRLEAFDLDATEVTVGAYARCVAKGACVEVDLFDAEGLDGPKRPMMLVSHGEAEAYCRFVGKRLPTEAEWARAARGARGRRYAWGAEAPTCTRARYGLPGDCTQRHPSGGTADVATTEGDTTPEGVKDLAGNVAEWVADWYAADAYARGGGPETGSERVIRGGGFTDAVDMLRADVRRHLNPNARLEHVGFRCAADAE